MEIATFDLKNGELDDTLFRWPSEDRDELKPFDGTQLTSENVEMWIGHDFGSDENAVSDTDSEDCKVDDDEEYQVQVMGSSSKQKSIFLFEQDVMKKVEVFVTVERTLKLYSDKLLSISKFNGMIVDTIELVNVGLVVQRDNCVILNLPDPKYSGVDTKRFGHWDMKYSIICSNEKSAIILKEQIYDATIHVHYGDDLDRVGLIYEEEAMRAQTRSHAGGKRRYKLYKDTLISLSNFNGIIVDKIRLTEVGLVVQRRNLVILYLPDPKYRGVDTKRFGHWDMKYNIVCSHEKSAINLKKRIYDATLHVHYE